MRDRYERKHRRTSKHPESVAMMSAMPPASAPAATAETEPRPAATDYACPECHGDTVLADRRDAVGICSRCGWFGPVGDAAPSGEEAESFAKLLDAYSDAAFALGEWDDEDRDPYENLTRDYARTQRAVVEYVAAQATELAALRALLQRVSEWGTRRVLGEPVDGIIADIRAALAPHQTTGDKHAK